MKVFEKAWEWLEGVMGAPREGLGRWARFVRFHVQLWRFCWRRLRESDALAMSSALSFRTIFALVPALVLTVLVANALNVLEDSKEGLRRGLDAAGFSNLVAPARERTGERQNGADRSAPTTQEGEEPAGETEGVESRERTWRGDRTATGMIMRMVDRVQEKMTLGTVGPLGLVILIWTSLTLFTTMEHSLNRIFEAPRSRSLGKRIGLYWSAMTLVPVIVAAAGYLANQAADTLRGMPILGLIVLAAGRVGYFVVGVAVLAGVYKLMPNTRTLFRASAVGAVVALPLWLAAKWGLSVYVQQFVGRQNLYGTLGLVPLFLFWVNLSWLIFLFGGQIAQTLANFRRLESAELARGIRVGPTEMLAGALVVARGYSAGGGPVPFEEVTGALDLPDATVYQILERLREQGIVSPVEGGGYVLARPAEKTRVLEVMGYVPAEEDLAVGAGDAWTKAALASAGERIAGAAGDYTLADVLRGAEAGA